MSVKAGHYEIFKSKNKEFCWRFIKNGKEIARCSETYKRKASAKRSIDIVMWGGGFEIKDLSKEIVFTPDIVKRK